MVDWDLLDEPLPVCPPAGAQRSPAENAELVSRARGLADDQLNRVLGVSRDDLECVAAQAEVYLATIRSYLEALGGGLHQVVSAPDGSSFTVDAAVLLGVVPTEWGAEGQGGGSAVAGGDGGAQTTVGAR